VSVERTTDAGRKPEGYPANLPLFIAFRVLFNARFYYPVLGVLFLDLGLSLEQYALLNVAWAATILLAEVPSGAMADLFGRKRMVVLASVLMVAEMAVFAFAPIDNAALLFWLLVLNRILSGLAEAAASGADEALAFDSLPEGDRTASWAEVLERLMRWKSAAFMVAMLVGAALFDASFLNQLIAWFGFDPGLDSSTTTRWPVYATCLTSLLCLGVSLAMKEPTSAPAPRISFRVHAISAWRQIWAGAVMVFSSRRVLLLLLAGLLADSFLRIFLTFGSNYYRLIQLPEAMNGVLGSLFAVIGFLAAPWARKLALKSSAPGNFLLIGILVFAGLLLSALAIPWWGLFVVLPLGLAMAFLQFFMAHYLNLWIPSNLRATVLSFKGVALNLGYGCAGIFFAGLTHSLRTKESGPSEDEVFGSALGFLPPVFLVCCLALLWFSRSKRVP